MEYSLMVKATNKAMANKGVVVTFDQQITKQPELVKIRGKVLANALAVIDLLDDDETKDIMVFFSGGVELGNANDNTTIPLSCVHISCNAYYKVRK